MFGLDLSTLIARAVTLLIAFTVHELAHAVTADYLGDPTPRNMGRITLNPLKHLDPIGTLLLLIAGFGWAKPVLVNPYNMRGNPRTAMAIVAVAGPLSNVLMAAMAAIFFRLGLVEVSFQAGAQVAPSLSFMMTEFVWINLILAFFNLIPVPPLDGSKILFAILPAEWAIRLEPVQRYGFIFVMLIVFIFPQVLNVLVQLPALATMNFLVG